MNKSIQDAQRMCSKCFLSKIQNFLSWFSRLNSGWTHATKISENGEKIWKLNPVEGKLYSEKIGNFGNFFVLIF